MEVSNKGRVAYGINDHRTVSYGLTTRGHKYVLEPRTKRKTSVHRLVAQEFHPNWDPSLIVHHKDGNKFNNCIENLFLSNKRSLKKKKKRKRIEQEKACFVGCRVEQDPSLAIGPAVPAAN